MDDILKQLTEINNELHKPFPYSDVGKIEKDFKIKFDSLSDLENSLTADFNMYCMNIAGTLSYLLAGQTNKIPENQIEGLRKTFFESYKQYRFIEGKIGIYEDFSKEYNTFEQARKLLLCVLSI